VDRTRYFDNAATTPVDPRVLEAYTQATEHFFANPNSQHSPGFEAMEAVREAQQLVAALIGAESPEQIFFASGATEAANWVLSQTKSVAISPFEHSAVREPALLHGAATLENEGFNLLPASSAYDLYAVMTVNNETGAMIEPPVDAGPLARDITQQVGKLPCSVVDCEFAFFSFHKLYGPKGIGALYARNPYTVEPFILGGEQQLGKRGGTIDVPSIVAAGVASEIALAETETNLRHAIRRRHLFLETLSQLQDWRMNAGEPNSAYILSVSFAGIEGESLVIELDSRGFAASAGAACSSRSTEPSHVLTALGLPEELLRGTVRISFGKYNSDEATEALGKAVCDAVAKLRDHRAR
jgi:cysteine desulfurase